MIITNILIGWNLILTILIILILFKGGDKELRLDKIERNIEENRVYDIIVEESSLHWRECYYPECKQRIVTVKEAIACLYRKCNFSISYTPETTRTMPEDVRIK